MTRLLAELKRRKVVRVAVVYAATAFAVLQAADIVLPRMGVPDWVMNLVVALLVLGFPIALVLAWALEVTPDGIRRTEATAVERSTAATPALLGKRTVFVSALLVVLGLGIGAGWFLRPAATPDGTPAAEPAGLPAATAPVDTDKSIAVLPFSDFSPGGDQGWFADGLAEEILNALARTPDLKVASRTASFAFRDTAQSPAEIGAALNVAHILEGSVRRAADQIRVTVQLIRTGDGYHLWSENFDGSIEDAIAIQEQIAFQIARALETAMDPEALAEMLDAGTRSVEAWEALLKAQALLEQASIPLAPSDVEQILGAASRAIEIDPGFSRAHGYLAAFWRNQMTPVSGVYNATDLAPAEIRANYDRYIQNAIREARSEAERLAYQADRAVVHVRYADRMDYLRRAVALRPEQADIHVELGRALIEAGDYEEAREVLLQALELGRGTAAELQTVYQFLHRVGPDAALPLVERALAADPGSQQVLYQGHRAMLYAGQVERAAELARALVLRDPDSEFSTILQVRQACAEGRNEDAAAIYERVDGDLIRWLLLKTLGRDAEAREFLRPLDTPDRLFSLSTYLAYTYFDPTDYPLLADTLARQGIERPPPRPIPFACKPAMEATAQ
jgi:TolB-like protein/Tfp pilus assembly protein PilF